MSLFGVKAEKCVTTPYVQTTYVVTGEYPNLSIQEYLVVAKDKYNTCVISSYTELLTLYPNNRCFKDYRSANDYVLEAIQKVTYTNKKGK